jgi:indole-3-glycerol phosphate synthase
MSTVLEQIIVGVKEDVLRRKLHKPNFNEELSSIGKPKDAFSALNNNEIQIIAEVKRSSPSKGALADISSPDSLAVEYEEAGAAVVSVLTEERRFKGSVEDFISVRKAIDIPMLRKDFIVDEYQIFESRAIGADLQLLIVAALSKSELRDFYEMGSELGMASLFEVHSESELEVAMDLDPKIVGVNSRNLKTLEIDHGNFAKLLPLIPDGVLRIAESGISTRTEVADLENLKANAILVGETLVKSESPKIAIAKLLGR